MKGRATLLVGVSVHRKGLGLGGGGESSARVPKKRGGEEAPGRQGYVHVCFPYFTRGKSCLIWVRIEIYADPDPAFYLTSYPDLAKAYLFILVSVHAFESGSGSQFPMRIADPDPGERAS